LTQWQIFTPGCAPTHGNSMEMISIGSLDLADAQRIDARMTYER
jgi:hypothetical protein